MFENLRKLRIEKNISAGELKEALGLKTEAAYYKKESGKIKFSLIEARIISKIFRMGIDEIFFADNVSKKETVSKDSA